ncbi:MAG TPA: hypothetical protein VMB03_12995 [Bryobacteraceae bacterium]|nr:hypothetical protein [Bryobacteraceae bacterium]
MASGTGMIQKEQPDHPGALVQMEPPLDFEHIAAIYDGVPIGQSPAGCSLRSIPLRQARNRAARCRRLASVPEIACRPKNQANDEPVIYV